MHAPDLHMPGALGIEVNIIPVRRVLRPVVETFSGGQTRLLSAGRGNRVMSKPPLRCPVNASVFPSGDHPCQYEGEFCVTAVASRRRRAQDKCATVIRLRRVAEGQPLPIGRNSVIVVAMSPASPVLMICGCTGSHRMHLRRHRQPLQMPVAVEDQSCTVAGPVRSFEVAGRHIRRDMPVCGT